MALKRLAETFDFLKPSLYQVEKAVASKQIPSVVDLPNRKKLADFAAVTTSSTNNVVFDHSLWDAVLKQHVVETNGSIGHVNGIHLVDYKSLSTSTDFQTYLGQLAAADVLSLPEPEQLAFWINAYNALCVSLLIQRLDQTRGSNGKYSINNLSNKGGGDVVVWDLKAGVIGGKDYSLNDIEHRELRGKWAEPAVHACIVCASASCPNLRPEAFVGSKVGEQMKDQMRLWMKNDTKGLVLKKKHNRLYLSRIFLWFSDDFGGWNGIREWLPQFLEDGAAKSAIAKNAVSLRFFDYDWQMNRKEG